MITRVTAARPFSRLCSIPQHINLSVYGQVACLPFLAIALDILGHNFGDPRPAFLLGVYLRVALLGLGIISASWMQQIVVEFLWCMRSRTSLRGLEKILSPGAPSLVCGGVGRWSWGQVCSPKTRLQ